ncbi:MAG: hypothetical protein ACJ72Z_01360, partial [Pyrinomonadaceae bacterium]
NGIRVVIIDDLSAIKRTNDGVRETLAFIRQLKQLCEELGISVLAVSDAAEPKNGEVSENDLGRSRILCTVADSVFAIGRTRHSEDGRYIIQRRSRSAKVFWNVRNAPVATIKHLESHMLGFEFDERFSPELDQEKLDLILTVKMMHDEGASFRDIGEMLGISKSYAYVAYRKWTPAMETGLQYVDDEELPVGSEKWIAISQQHAEDPDTPEPRKEGSFVPNPSEIPFAAGLKRRSVYDFEFDFDGYGNQIFVETRREHDRKPIVWYRMDRDVTRRFERGAFGIQVQQFAAGPFL